MLTGTQARQQAAEVLRASRRLDDQHPKATVRLPQVLPASTQTLVLALEVNAQKQRLIQAVRLNEPRKCQPLLHKLLKGVMKLPAYRAIELLLHEREVLLRRRQLAPHPRANVRFPKGRVELLHAYLPFLIPADETWPTARRALVLAVQQTGAEGFGSIPFPQKHDRFQLQAQSASMLPVIFDSVLVHKRAVDIRDGNDQAVDVLTKFYLSGAISIRFHLL